MENKIQSLSRKALEAELKKYKEIVEMFTNSVLGGVARMSLVDMHIMNGTEGYYRMTGYSEKESLEPPFSNCGMNLVVPEDMNRIEKAIVDMVEKDKVIHIDYRIQKKDGSIVWNSAFCMGVQENDKEQFDRCLFLRYYAREETTQAKSIERRTFSHYF